MSEKKKLDSDEREFFALVARAAFANPFSEERLELDRRMSGTETSGLPLLTREGALARFEERIAALDDAKKGSLAGFSGADRGLLHSAFLFDIYHRLCDRFDAHIQDQLRAGDTPAVVSFAPDAFALFARRGFDDLEAARYFAFFFQMRRAFFFLSKSLSGRSPVMDQLRRRLWGNLFTHDIHWYEEYLWDRMEDFSTLLLGETGTGKGTAAAALGRSGFIPFDQKKGAFAESFTRNFIDANLSRFPDSLVESELFGHRKGAFTGAVADYDGLFARCRPHGAIFLDEIGDVPVPVQVKLLQIFQERTFSALGSHEKLRFSGRVIAATNRPLDELRRQGDFRSDFYYRLCSDVIQIPTLRQRVQEDPAEMGFLVGEVVARTIGRPDLDLSREIKARLEVEPGPDYLWPGNVRELEQAVRRVLLCGFYPGEVSALSIGDPVGRLQRDVAEGTLSAPDLLAGYCRILHGRLGTFEKVAHVTGLDRRTVKKYVELATPS